MKIFIEVPDNWFDIDSPSLYASRDIANQVKEQVKEQVAEQYIKKIKLPRLNITNKELRKAVLNKMAERAIEQNI
jgi:hypothetical protein